MSLDGRFEPLPSELRRRRDLAAREAERGVNWLDDCPPEAGRRIAALLPHVTNAPGRVLRRADDHRKINSASGLFLTGAHESLEGEGDDKERLDVVAAIFYALRYLAVNDTEQVEEEDDWNRNWVDPHYDVEAFTETVNDMLLGARVEWLFDDGKFVPRGNTVLHAEVVKPVTILLDADPKFATASRAFQTALNRLAENKPDVAITDAATALQEFFRALGVEGNSLPDQLNAAGRLKIISPVDRSLMKPIVDWTNADRSNRGNAHRHREGDVSRPDAWLMLHVSAALMVRLSNEEPRDIVAAREKRDAEARAAQERKQQAETAAAAAAADVWSTPGTNYNDETPF